MARNKKWPTAPKFEIALLAIKVVTTLNEVCKRYLVAPSQVRSWKKQLLEQGAHLFSKSDKTANTQADSESTQRALYEKIGQLTVERDFLKKAWGKLSGPSDEN